MNEKKRELYLNDERKIDLNVTERFLNQTRDSNERKKVQIQKRKKTEWDWNEIERDCHIKWKIEISAKEKETEIFKERR